MSIKWIITYNTMFYPWVEVYDTYEEAKPHYDEYAKRIEDHEAVYLTEAKEYTAGSNYDPEE